MSSTKLSWSLNSEWLRQFKIVPSLALTFLEMKHFGFFNLMLLHPISGQPTVLTFTVLIFYKVIKEVRFAAVLGKLSLCSVRHVVVVKSKPNLWVVSKNVLHCTRAQHNWSEPWMRLWYVTKRIQRGLLFEWELGSFSYRVSPPPLFWTEILGFLHDGDLHKRPTVNELFRSTYPQSSLNKMHTNIRIENIHHINSLNYQ